MLVSMHSILMTHSSSCADGRSRSDSSVQSVRAGPAQYALLHACSIHLFCADGRSRSGSPAFRPAAHFLSIGPVRSAGPGRAGPLGRPRDGAEARRRRFGRLREARGAGPRNPGAQWRGRVGGRRVRASGRQSRWGHGGEGRAGGSPRHGPPPPPRASAGPPPAGPGLGKKLKNLTRSECGTDPCEAGRGGRPRLARGPGGGPGDRNVSDLDGPSQSGHPGSRRRDSAMIAAGRDWTGPVGRPGSGS